VGGSHFFLQHFQIRKIMRPIIVDNMPSTTYSFLSSMIISSFISGSIIKLVTVVVEVVVVVDVMIVV